MKAFFLFGAKPGVAEAAAVKLLDEYVGLNIVGVHHGYFRIMKPMILLNR